MLLLKIAARAQAGVVERAGELEPGNVYAQRAKVTSHAAKLRKIRGLLVLINHRFDGWRREDVGLVQFFVAFDGAIASRLDGDDSTSFDSRVAIYHSEP